MGFVLWFALLLSIKVSTTYAIKDVPVHKIEVLNGETLYLPCNVSTFENDEVLLILWYREDKGTPIYSVDARGGFSKAAKRWSDESVLGDRAYFIFDKEPGILSIENAKNTDTGVYRCRVDFAKAQTRNIKFKVTVIVQPKQIIIRDDSDVERSTVVGPYSEGDIITLKCEVIGGKPLPKITWYRDGVQLDTDTIVLPGDTHVQSEITLGPLGREDLNSKLVCKASNHVRATPIETSVQIDMNFAPLNIRLLGAHQPLSAGRRYDLLCQSAGSRPPAVITWWQNGMRLEKTTETTSSDGNQTTSTLSITLNKSDAGKYLSCKAYNHIISGEPLEDGWKLDIQYIPEAYVRLGSSLDPNSIREGSDVYFDCLVLAHPPVYRVEWRLNGRALPHNISQGVIISNHSLVLQGVTRATAGNYSCVGYNEEGEGISPPFQLNILFTPTCAANQPKIYGVAKQEDAKIRCTVDANPPDVEFTWTFNNSAESIDVATNHIARSGTSSVVTYTPITELDYGTLLCIATNKIGRQRVPCIFHIIAAGRPDQVHNCTLNNISMTSLTVTCSEGFNGGLPQLFILEIIDMHSNEIKSNITSTYPRFTVAALQPGSVYMLSIYAYNSKGRSDATTLNAAMLRMPEKQLTSEQVERAHAELMFSPMISLTIGLTLAVTVALFAVILALRIPCNNARRRADLPNDNISRSGSPGPSDKSYGSKDVDDSDDRNPDVVPDTNDPEDQVAFERRKQHIATIDATNSPTRDAMCKTPPPPQQQQNFNASEMTLYTHNMGYCTLRNGIPIAAPPGTLHVSMAPHVYSKSITQCTLPRGSNQGMWSGYGPEAAMVRHVGPPVTALHQMSMPSTSKQMAPMQMVQHSTELASSNNSGSSMGSNLGMGKTIVLQHITQSQRGRICVGIGNPGIQNVEANCMSDDEATVQTPLVFKKESTV